MFWCPGCDGAHLVRTGNGPGPRWGFDGDYDKPTFTPSVLVTYNGSDAGVGGAPTATCHSFVRDGQIQFLGDCTHALGADGGAEAIRRLSRARRHRASPYGTITMRMLILASAASLALAGCTTTEPVAVALSPIDNVQSATATACQFLPAAETVAEILASGDPRLTTASAVARAICAALVVEAPTGTATLFSAPPMVAGVVIRGERLPGGGGT